MKTRRVLTVAALATVLGASILPALSQAPPASGAPPGEATMGGMMNRGMVGQRVMLGGMMNECAAMMAFMGDGNARPNSQWRAHPQHGMGPH